MHQTINASNFLSMQLEASPTTNLNTAHATQLNGTHATQHDLRNLPNPLQIILLIIQFTQITQHSTRANTTHINYCN